MGTVSYSPSIVTMAVYVAVCEIFSVKEWCDLENRVRVRSRSLENTPFDRSHTTSCRSATVNIAQSCNILTLNKGVILKDYSTSLEITRFERRHSTQYIVTMTPISCH